jgi:hypothetical protein
MEQVLGIRPTGAGFRTVEIRPDLMGLKFARGAEPTPHGLLKVDVTPERTIVDLPEGVTASVSMAGSSVKVNGAEGGAGSVPGEARTFVKLSKAGHYVLESR